MNELSGFNPVVLIVLVVFVVLIRYGYERLISLALKALSIEITGLQIFIRSLLSILFNIGILLAFGLLAPGLFQFLQPGAGAIFLGIGTGLALLVAGLSYLALRAGYGRGYEILVRSSTINIILTLFTFLFLVGPSEDLFFIGFAQNILTPQLGWIAIIVYLVLFVAFHYANVLSGVEKKEEFLGTLPVRLLASIVLALSFYFTKSLVYGFIIHNLTDTLSYLVLLYAGNRKTGKRK